MRRVLGSVGLLQIDSVNVFERAHYLPLFSRLGPYPKRLLDQASWRAPRKLFEYWGHEASLIPVATQPFLRWRMARAAEDAWGGIGRIQRDEPALVEHVFGEVRDRGPLAASELGAERPKRSGPWWDWSREKLALEWLFWSGRITAARRRNFERLYDIPERVLPSAVMRTSTPPVEAAQRELLRVAGRALGVATEADLREYFRMSAVDAKPRLAELVESGELLEVAVEGWGRGPAYLWHEARVPRAIDTAALIGPFDSLLWARKRVQRIFNFTYKLELYVPRERRVHGYYVLPFLLGDRLVARVDLKADRPRSLLAVKAIHMEPDAPAHARPALTDEVALAAEWLGFECCAELAG